MMPRPLVYVCSRLRATAERSTSENVRRAKLLCRVASRTVAPFAPHLLFSQFLDDSIAWERAAGIECGLSWLDSCDELWVDDVFGVSAGMQAEIDYARRLGKPVVVNPDVWRNVP